MTIPQETKKRLKNLEHEMHVQQIFHAYDSKHQTATTCRYKYCSRCGAQNVLIEHDGRPRITCTSCGGISYRNPLPGVSVLIENEGTLLLGRRVGGGAWCLPCGFVEYDEDIITAALREVFEETGLTISLCSIIQVTSNFLAENIHSIVTVFLANVKGGTIRAGDDIDKVEWFALHGPFPPLAFEADREIINRYAHKKIRGLPVQSI